MKKFFGIPVLTAMIMLSGCGLQQVKYNPDNINENQLAYIETETGRKVFSSDYDAVITNIWTENGFQVREHGGIMAYYAGKAILKPGNYTIQGACLGGQRKADVETKVSVEGGKRYQLFCDIEKGKNILGMTVDAFATFKIKELN